VIGLQKLTFTNSADETLVISYAKPYILQNLVGISDAPVELLSTRGYQQDGQTPAGQYYQARLVSFAVAVMGNTLAEVFESRRNLIKFLNPKETFSCVYQNDYTSVRFDCRIDSPPGFQPTQNNGGLLYQMCSIVVIADDPYLLDPEDTMVEMAIAEPLFRFPLIFTPDIRFSSLLNPDLIITNIGDVETPVRIRIYGNTENPVITNITTGEFIKVNQTVESGKILEITTGYGDKRVEIIDGTGVRTNAFNYIDLSSTFWQLAVGPNRIEYSADNGVSSAPIYIYYSNRYVGV
jgi:hypothetical protein